MRNLRKSPVAIIAIVIIAIIIAIFIANRNKTDLPSLPKIKIVDLTWNRSEESARPAYRGRGQIVCDGLKGKLVFLTFTVKINGIKQDREVFAELRDGTGMLMGAGLTTDERPTSIEIDPGGIIEELPFKIVAE